MKLKKMLCLFLMMFSFFLLVSCEKTTTDSKDENNTTDGDINPAATFTITYVVDNQTTVVKEYANGTSLTYEMILNDACNGEVPFKKGYDTNFEWYTSNDYAVKASNPYVVTANASLHLKWNKFEKAQPTLFMVGDSTVCSFSDSYYYPRYGYGTQIENFLEDSVKIKNYAKSGRSSRSYISEYEYTLIKDGQTGDNISVPGISKGDYLLIGFGHNDQKSGDTFTDARKDTNDSTSFKYYLYEYYVKLALENEATPILCTPIVRANSTDDYSGQAGHNIATGDYAQAIRDLASEYNIPLIDLTKITAERYTELGYSEAKWYHAFTGGKYDDYANVVLDEATVDNTHLNIYGAKYVAYRFIEELKKTSCSLKHYVLDSITEPTKENDLVHNDSYKLNSFYIPVLSAYEAPDHFKTTSDGWYGTAFGYTKVNPNDASKGFVATETSTGVFKVGQSGSIKYGKFNDSKNGDGFAFVFQQIDKSKNFVLTANAKVITAGKTANTGFGLMVRDECYIRQEKSFALATNFVGAGLTTSGQMTYALFDRTVNKTGSVFTYKENQAKQELFAADETASLKIERQNQTIIATVTYNGETYTKSYPDFDLFTIDTKNLYVGMFATNGTVAEFTDVVLTITGTAQGA